MVGQGTDAGLLAVVADADDGNVAGLDQGDQLLKRTNFSSQGVKAVSV